MKALLPLILLAFALSLCNLTRKRSNSNLNNNSSAAEKSTPAQNSNSTEPASEPPPPTIGSGMPPASRDQNRGVPQLSEAPPSPRTSPKVPRAPISAGVLNGKAIRLVQPPYPAIARAAHASGQVTVQVVVDENGNVISARPVSGHPLLQGAAVAAARASKFSPTLLSGQPVKVIGVVIYHFVAQ